MDELELLKREIRESARPTPEEIRSRLPVLPVDGRPRVVGLAARNLPEERPVDPRDLETAHIRDVGRRATLEDAPLTQDARNRLLWERAFFADRLTLQDLHPYRIRAVWRMTREMARCMGFVTDEETILHGTSLQYPQDPWTEPVPYVQAASPWSANVRAADHFHQLLTGNDRAVNGLALLPPAVPEGAGEDYDPEKDERLCRYICAYLAIERSLNISLGSATDPDAGRFGLMYLFEPPFLRLLWPTRSEIVAFEEKLIDETMNYLVNDGHLTARRYLREEHGLGEREAKTLILIARIYCRQRTEGTELEDERALHLLRLEEFVKRAQGALDHRAELAALKQIAIILGLGRAEPEDTLRDFVEVVKKVSGEKADPALPGRDAKMLDMDDDGDGE